MDTELQLLSELIIFNDKINPRLPYVLREYKNVFHELTVTHEGIILRGNQILIPSG